MSAAQKIKTVKKLGLIAGGGVLPRMLVEECHRQGIYTFIVGFVGQTDKDLMAISDHEWSSLGSVKHTLDSFRRHDIQDLVMIGTIRRPKLKEIKPDMKAAQILARIGFRALGDNGLLVALKQELEAEGFALHGIHEFCGDLLAQEGHYSALHPDEDALRDIEIGIIESQKIGLKDIGQSVVVQNGEILGHEDNAGTDALIARSGKIKRPGRGPILIKTCKPQQDRSLDMPTIGPNTIENAHAAGFSGVVFQAGATLLVEPKMIEEKADHYKMFVKAVKIGANAEGGDRES